MRINNNKIAHSFYVLLTEQSANKREQTVQQHRHIVRVEVIIAINENENNK